MHTIHHLSRRTIVNVQLTFLWANSTFCFSSFPTPVSLFIYTYSPHQLSIAQYPTLSISWLDDSFFWEFQAGHPLSTFFCRFLSCQDALMITFFNPPSTHRLDNDPASDPRLRCGAHLAQNRPHRSWSSPCDIGKPRFFMYFQII